MLFILTMVLRALLRILRPVIALIDRLVPGVPGKDTVLPDSDHDSKPPTSNEDVEAALTDLVASRTAWQALDHATKADLLQSCKKLCHDNYASICEDATARKGSYAGGLGDEMCATTKAKEVTGARLDNLLLGGGHAEIWMRPGQDATQGACYKNAKGSKALPGVCCILAAGNHIAVVMRDIMQQLVINNNLCIVKINPCNDWVGPAIGTVLEPLVNAGALRIVYGGAPVAQKLIADDRVTALHMTGSTATYNAIVWGPGGPASGEQLVSKPFEAELGCVSPYIIVPGNKRWSQAELRYHAQMAISSTVMNSGHNCLSTELIVTCGSWPQRQEFVEALKWALDSISQRWPWYPGSQARMDAFRARFRAATEHGIGICTMRRCTHPFLLASGLAPDEAQTTEETWGPALQEVALPVPLTAEGEVDVPAFLDAAVAFCNERCFGTLSCGLSVHPSARAAHGTAVRAAVADLRYGAVAVNTSPSYMVSFATIPWGAWAAAGTPEDIGSGNVLSHVGVYDHAEKGVLWSPWMVAPKPLVFPSYTNSEQVVRRLLRYIAAPGPVSVTRFVAANLRSE